MVCLEGQGTHEAVLWESGGKVAERTGTNHKGHYRPQKEFGFYSNDCGKSLAASKPGSDKRESD